VRLKFERGIVPEQIAEEFVRFIRGNEIVVGDVNIYFQALGEDRRYHNEVEIGGHQRVKHVIFYPSAEAQSEYVVDSARVRRNKFKVV